VAIVLAGAPARVALGSTTNLATATAAFEGLDVSDRATDLDGAVSLAKGLLRGLAQRDKRVVVLSDLADGSPADAPPLGGEPDADVTIWTPLPELAAAGQDCAVTRADRSGSKVSARVVCTAPGGAAAGLGPSDGRTLEIRDGAKVVVSSPLGAGGRSEEIVLDLPPQTPPDALVAVLTGTDAIAEDDRAPVVAAGGALPMAVVVDTAATHVATGGPPPIEQALAALEVDAQVHPLPAVPEHADELATVAALVIDDVPGFTPAVRRAIAAWVERGGVLLLTLGPRAAAAPLGASFDPLVPGVVRWGPSPVKGIDPMTAAMLGPSAEGFADVAPRGRATVDPEVVDGADVLARWKDGAPLLLRRSRGRGAVLALTLPLSTDESDLALRPAFLALLDRFVGTARARGGARRVDVGEAWTFDGYKTVKVERVPLDPNGKPTPLAVLDGEGPGTQAGVPGGVTLGGGAQGASEKRLRATPQLAGLYTLELDGERTTRVAAVPDREIDLRARRVRDEAHAASLGGVDPALDVSPQVALALLGLFAIELVLRLVGQRAARAAPPA
jgi:hypothetical protein